jgi:hypothetical protein
MTSIRTLSRRLPTRAFLLGASLCAVIACGGPGGGKSVDPQLLPPPVATDPGIAAGDVAIHPPYGTQFTEHLYASGMVANTTDAPLATVPYVLHVPDAMSLRVIFDEVRIGEASTLEVESTYTGETQEFTADEVERWRNTTAHFKGDTVTIRMNLAPHAQGSFTIHGVFDGLKEIPPVIEPQSQCGAVDNRVASGDPRTGRLNGGCTMWLVGSNGCALSAGHCFSGFGSPFTFPHVVEFNVPLSNGDGSLNPAPVRDQYPIAIFQFVDNPANDFDIPDDWAVGRLGLNNLGETAVSRQGVGYLVDDGTGNFGPTVMPVFPLVGDPITITGYGVDVGTANQTNQTHTGPFAGFVGDTLRYHTDTEGGNSGSPIFSDFDGAAIGIHTNAGCNVDDTGDNAGVRTDYGPISAALATLCTKAAPSITGPADFTAECNGGGAWTGTLDFPTSDPDLEVVFVEFRVDGVLEGSDTVPGVGVAQFTFAFPIGGPYVVVATATNATGTQASHTLNVTVQDTTAPVITCPGDITVECTGGGQVVTFPDPTVVEDCDAFTLDCVPASGSVFPLGTTTVTCTVTDGVGLQDVCTFDVIVEDTTPPVLTASVGRTFLWLPMNGMVDVGLSATATDDCDADVDVEVTVISDESNASTAPTPDAEIIGIAPAQRLRLRAQRDPIVNNGRWYVVVVSAADDAGNRTTQSFVVVAPYNLTTSQINAIRALGNAAVPLIVSTYPPTTPPGAFQLLAPSPFN